jgi:hypothetical protein
MPKYTVTFNVKLNEELTISINANGPIDASDAADVIAYEIASDPTFLVESLKLECTSIEAEPSNYTPLTNAEARPSPTHSDETQYTSLASLYAQRPQPCAPCQGSSSPTPGYTRLT